MTSTNPELSIPEAKPRSFPEDCKEVLQGLRGALTAGLCAVDVDPARPQEVARQLGLHRNLTWKISKIITGTNAFAAVTHVPGRSGMEILKKALRQAGAPAGVMKRLVAAVAEFDRLVDQHAGDRATLDLVASGFVPEASQREALVQARRLAFRGNSATWKVQARVLLSTRILAPSHDDPRRVDLVQILGIIDFRRLQPDVPWPLFRRQLWDGSGSLHPLDGLPVEPDTDPTGVPLIRGFCSPDLPRLNVIRVGAETEYELPAGPVGRLGELTVVYGVIVPSIGSQFATADERVCELATNLRTPAELMHSDVLVHESLGWAMQPRADVYSLLEGREVFGQNRRASSLVVGDNDVHELGQGLATMATPHVPRYTELLTHVFECLGWDEARFRGFRWKIAYPPIPAVGMVSMDLAIEE